MLVDARTLSWHRSNGSIMNSIHYTVLCKHQSIILHHCCMQEEVQKLQAEVAQLDIKLAEVNQILAKATVARKDERYSTEKRLLLLAPLILLTMPTRGQDYFQSSSILLQQTRQSSCRYKGFLLLFVQHKTRQSPNNRHTYVQPLSGPPRLSASV